MTWLSQTRERRTVELIQSVHSSYVSLQNAGPFPRFLSIFSEATISAIGDVTQVSKTKPIKIQEFELPTDRGCGAKERHSWLWVQDR
jgi:hypothetical protein